MSYGNAYFFITTTATYSGPKADFGGQENTSFQVAKIDVKQETPVDHGEIICFSIYSGPKADFGNGKSCIWVDVLDGGGKDILVKFKPFFENPEIKKVSFFFWYATL